MTNFGDSYHYHNDDHSINIYKPTFSANIMNIKKLLSSLTLAALTMVSLNASAGNISATAAREAANNFLKQQATATPGTLRAPALSDLKLTHSEPSSAVNGAFDYYVFNIKGGGFVIVAGEDRAVQVLGYSDKGQMDMNRLPSNVKALLDGYKAEIEFLQTYKGNDLVIETPKITATAGVEPLIKTTWGQEMPYYLQCPIYHNEYCVVGCVATAMAQVMNYWQYPTSCGTVASYYCYDIGQRIQALPATTFDYSKMLPSYCHWDWDNSQLIQDTYTDEQAQEVAKLSRYCGQAVEMSYSPDGSGAYTWEQLDAMKSFGYSENARDISKSSLWGWGGDNYTTAEWEDLLKVELDAGRPILYSANDPSSGGHAFICDGYNAAGYFHFNYGWYGTCDGWYLSTSLRMVHRDGDNLNFSAGHEILAGVEPPSYCLFNVEGLNADNNLLVLGDAINTQALNVTYRTTYNTVGVVFGLADESGAAVCNGQGVALTNNFVQGSTVEGSITLPTTLAQGMYDMKLYYYTTSANDLTAVNCEGGKLMVLGHLAKYNEPFNVGDVSTVIGYLLADSKPNLNMGDVAILIEHLLNGE